MTADRICTVVDCEKPRKTIVSGLCGMHTERMRRSGTTDDLRPTPETRFWAKVDKSGECWLWLGKLINTGYGSFCLDGKMQLAHRVSFAWANGSVPDGLVVDHLCRNSRRVRPAHLEAVTQRQNTHRGVAPSAIAYLSNKCLKGHDYTPENTYVSKGSRKCRECTITRRRERAAERRASEAS